MIVLTVIVAQRLRRRPPRRARPAREGEGRALVLAFLVRRTIGAILVCIAVTFIVFVIFIVVPGGDPAQRIAGKNATPQNIINIRHDWGFDRPFYVQYYKLMQKMVDGTLVSYTSQQNVAPADRAGHAGDVLAQHRRRSDLALLRDHRGGVIRGLRGQAVGSRHHDLRAGRGLGAGFLARHRDALLPRGGRADDVLPGRGVRAAHGQSRAVVLPPHPPVGRPRRGVHRLLRPRAARERPRHVERGLRPHCEGEGIDAEPDHAQAHPAHCR